MKKRTFVITVLAVLATAGSVSIGARAIVGTTATLRDGAATAQASQGGAGMGGSEVSALIADLSETDYPDWAVGRERDPMVPYRPPVRRTAATPRGPSRPSYKVKAVFLDQDPTAVILTGGETVIVRVGDTLNGDRVIAIETEGVIIESEAGTQLYTLPLSN